MPPTGDEELLAWLPLVRHIAGRIRMRMPRSVDFDDLVQDGWIAVWRQSNRYDPSKGASLRTYLTLCVRRAIYDGIKQRSDVSKHHRRRLARAGKSIDVQTGGLLWDLPQAGRAPVGERIERDDDARHVRRTVAALPSPMAEMVAGVCLAGLSMGEAAEVVGLPADRAAKFYRAGLEILGSRMAA